MKRSLLVVDDDHSLQRLIQRVLEPNGWEVYGTDSATEALRLFESQQPTLVILDLHLPTIHGIDLLDVMRQRDPNCSILILTGDLNPDLAGEVMQQGAELFLTKPISNERLGAVVEEAYENVSQRRRKTPTEPPSESVVGKTEKASLGSYLTLQLLSEQIRRIAPSDSSVLLEGETGCGKSLAARMLHGASPRAQGPLVEIHCAALTPVELEREIFGYEEGAVPGAHEAKRGLLELAGGGSLLLEEVDSLPLELQPKLLRVLDSGYSRRLGGTRGIEIDVRVIATTRDDLLSSVRAARFREDLYYRLAGCPLRLPALRDWSRADLLSLAGNLLAELQPRARFGRSVRISDAAADLLVGYSWPGNVRELRSVLERILRFHEDLSVIRPEHLPEELRGRTQSEPEYPLDPSLSLEQVEQLHIEAALRLHQGNRSAAAQSLGISRATLYNKLNRYGLQTASSGTTARA